MEMHICPRCGENLVKEGSVFRCRYCLAEISEESEGKGAYALKDILDEAKAERLANAKRLLWNAAHEKYPSERKVIDAAEAVLLLDDADFLAGVYLHSHDRDPQRLNAILSSSVSVPEAEEAYRWLLPSLSLETIGSLRDFTERHFVNKARVDRVNQIEEESFKLDQAIYEVNAPREVFLCYSSKDMPKVVETMNILERNGLTCFAAFRNLRHGKGAQENYLDAIKAAMRACDTLVFVSSVASRSMYCDALKVELQYLIQECPGKPRVEYLIEDYTGSEAIMVKKILKKAFPEQEWCVDPEDLVERVYAAIENNGKDKSEEEAEKLRKALEEERARHEKELEKVKAVAERLTKEEAARKAEEASKRAFDEEAIRKEIEEKYRKKLEEEEAKRRIEEETKRKSEEERRKKVEEEEAKRQIEEETKRKPEEERQKKAEEEKANRKSEEEKAKRATAKPRIDGGFVTYGEYPQSKADPSLSAALDAKKADARGYVEFQGKRYCKSKKGEWFLVEPIRWRVLKKKAGEAYLLSESVLDVHRFDPKSKNYTSSEIRKWLNGEFLKRAFENADAIVETDDGKVFLLSKEDMENVAKKAKATAFAISNGVLEYKGFGCYWTQSPRFGLFKDAWFVGYVGTFIGGGVLSGNIGVRPGLRISIAK